MKIQYEALKFRGRAVEIIAKANEIIADYASQGYSLTLRQLYYQFVARDLFPESWVSKVTGSKNCQQNYDKLGTIISNGRRAGLIDWDAIVDRTRFLRDVSTWESPSGIVGACASQFKLDLWADQANYVELWFEKDALLGVFERASHERRVPHFSCRGYVSDSELWSASQRIARFEHAGHKAYVLHFGDHDPSGLDMTRDIEARFNLFGATPEVRRLALNIEQVKKYNPPPNPAKQTDSRYEDYAAEFGTKSWELDALNPDVLVKLVTKEITKLIQPKRWDEAMTREDEAKEELRVVAEHWNAAVAGAKIDSNQDD